MHSIFEWDENKNKLNIEKHGVSFEVAKKAFYNEERLIRFDEKHSQGEARHFCIADVDGDILTVRFVYRGEKIRIFGAGYWREGRKFYEERE